MLLCDSNTEEKCGGSKQIVSIGIDKGVGYGALGCALHVRVDVGESPVLVVRHVLLWHWHL